MSEFISDKDFVPDQAIKSKATIGSDSFIPDSEFVSDEQKYGEGVLNPLKAAGLGAARTASFGAW